MYKARSSSNRADNTNSVYDGGIQMYMSVSIRFNYIAKLGGSAIVPRPHARALYLGPANWPPGPNKIHTLVQNGLHKKIYALRLYCALPYRMKRVLSQLKASESTNIVKMFEDV